MFTGYFRCFYLVVGWDGMGWDGMFSNLIFTFSTAGPHVTTMSSTDFHQYWMTVSSDEWHIQVAYDGFTAKPHNYFFLETQFVILSDRRHLSVEYVKI